MKYYCSDIFQNIYIDLHNDDSIDVAPCCQADIRTVLVKDFDFSKDVGLSQMRNTVRAGGKDPRCHVCWSMEELGGTSRRMTVPQRDDRVEMRSLDINTTWACNLACIMCGPHNSSTWAKELGIREIYDTGRVALRQMGRSFQKRNKFWDHLDFNRVDSVHFNGGEPLINSNHRDILESIRDQGDLSQVSVSYNTNATQPVDESTISLWNQARSVKLYLSIDAINSAFEYIRWPANWHQVQENIRQIQNQVGSTVEIGVNFTLGCYNVLEMVDVYQWYRSNIFQKQQYKLDQGVDNFNWQIAQDFDLCFLNDTARAAAIASLSAVPRFNSLIDYLSKNQHRDDRWIDHLQEIDQRRGTNWRQNLKIATYYNH